MKVTHITTLLVRLTAILLLLYALELLPSAYLYSSLNGMEDYHYFPWITFGAALLLAIVLWFLPSTISGIITPNWMQDVELRDVNVPAIEQAAIGTIGLWLLVWFFPDMINNVFPYLQAHEGSPEREQILPYIYTTIAEGLIGVFLILRSEGLHKLIVTLRSK